MGKMNDTIELLKAGDLRMWRDWLFWGGLLCYGISVPGQFTNDILSGEIALGLFVASVVIGWRAS